MPYSHFTTGVELSVAPWTHATVVGDRHFYSGNEALSFLVADLRGSQVGLLDHSQKGVPFTYRFRGRKLSVQAFKAEVASQILSVRSDHHPALEGHQPSREFPVLFQVHWEAVPYRSLKSAPPMSGTFLSRVKVFMCSDNTVLIVHKAAAWP